MKIKYDISTIQHISLFESLTRAKVKDCIKDTDLLFIIEKGQMGLALGKNASNLRRVEKALKKKIRLVEFDEDPCAFIKNYVYPLRKFKIRKDDKTITITGDDTKTKSLLIGRDKTHLKKITDMAKRFFNIENVHVV